MAPSRKDAVAGPLNAEEVRRIAALAALRLTEDEVDRLAGELSDILDHFRALADVDTTDAAESEATDAPLRPDAPGADPLAAEPRAGAPGWDAGFFTVPRLSSHAGDEP